MPGIANIKPYQQKIFLFVSISLLALAVGFAQKSQAFNRDSLKFITKEQFDRLVDVATVQLQSKKLSDISDEEHINIMMCLNTIFMAHDSSFQKRFTNGRYDRLERIAEEKKYAREIVNVYPEWVPNRGMGFYSPKLRMELYGTPRLYAWFQVKKEANHFQSGYNHKRPGRKTNH